MKWREFFLYFWWDLVFLHYDLNELTASFACWFLVAKNISYCQYWKIEYISLDDIGADGRIFGSGISFNNTSLSDIGDQISRWLSTHFWWQIWQTFFCSANVVLVAGLLGVLYYLTFSGDSGAVNYSVKNKEAVTLILDCTQGARSNETLQDLTITYHCCRFVIVIVINVCPNPNCNYHQCRFQLLWKLLQASTIRDSTDGRGSRWAHHGLVLFANPLATVKVKVKVRWGPCLIMARFHKKQVEEPDCESAGFWLLTITSRASLDSPILRHWVRRRLRRSRLLLGRRLCAQKSHHRWVFNLPMSSS